MPFKIMITFISQKYKSLIQYFSKNLFNNDVHLLLIFISCLSVIVRVIALLLIYLPIKGISCLTDFNFMISNEIDIWLL